MRVMYIKELHVVCMCMHHFVKMVRPIPMYARMRIVRLFLDGCNIRRICIALASDGIELSRQTIWRIINRYKITASIVVSKKSG